MSIESRDELVAHPTWLEHVRFFFDSGDIECMKKNSGLDLATYEGVKSNATQIYFQTSAGKMPPQAARRWPANRVLTFKNWIADKYPVGVAPLDESQLKAAADGGDVAIRPNAASLSSEGVELLKKAFMGIMARDTKDAQSYFALAGLHWFPSPTHCMHHEPRYNPWHRVYVDRFENALRSVEGCESVKLPYWDITASIPEWFFEAPFDSYKIPEEVSPMHPAGTQTERHTKAVIEANLEGYDVKGTIKTALDSPKWEDFTRNIEAAHDNGHVSIGPAMETPSIAAFDPIFWFFHCNWERLWWSWQKRHSAQDLSTFKQTIIEQDHSWLDTDPFNELVPFGVTADKTIDASPYAYEESTKSLFSPMAHVTAGHVTAERAFRLGTDPRLSLRVKGIERLRLRSSFVVHLVADGQTIARQAFFQSETPVDCPNCVKRAKVDVDLMVDRDQAVGRHLEVKIESLERGRQDRWVPLEEVGSPTINMRELLVTD